MKTIFRTVFVLRDRDRVLLLQRPRNVIWEEMWEFPTLAIRRINSRPQISDEIKGQLGLSVELDRRYSKLKHQLTHRTILYRVFSGKMLQRSNGVRLPDCDSGRY